MAGSSSVKGIVALILLVASFDSSRTEEVVLSINSKKPFAVTSERFLSISLDPDVILTGSLLTKNTERNINMAKALAPAFVRIAGPRSNSYIFKRPYQIEKGDPDYTFTEGNWNMVNQWAENAGLDLVAAVAPQQHSEGNSGSRDNIRDSQNILELISFSDQKGFNVSWQLGFECQTQSDLDGKELGKDVTRLRNMLEAYPRFAGKIITGPDVVTFETKQQQVFLQDYLDSAINALSAITWHPNFASITVDQIGVSMHYDNLASDKDALYRIIGRHMAKKPLWLAESKVEEFKKQFLGALVWLRRLGNSAKLGAQVLMRQPQDSNLFEPTPDYWVSVLHKTLVGPEVLDTKITTGNRSHMNFYCQCTRPSSMYEKGLLTVFGVNLTPVKLSVTLKGLKIKTLHKYILLPGFDAEKRMFSETVLLNNEPLTLVNGTNIPDIKPVVVMSDKGLAMKLPSGGIGFWVIPDIKMKICEGQKNNAEKMILKRFTKNLDKSKEIDANVGMRNKRVEKITEEQKPLVRTFNKIHKKHHYDNQDQGSDVYNNLDAIRGLERIEKLLKWRVDFEEKRIASLQGKTAHMGFFNTENVINNDAKFEEEIRVKLQELKRRLSKFEVWKKEITSRGNEDDEDFLDNEKLMNAINKLENTLKISQYELPESLNPVNIDSSDSTGVIVEKNPLDQIMKTRIAREAIMPEKIEKQLQSDSMLARKRRNPDRWFGHNEPRGMDTNSTPKRRTQMIRNKKKNGKIENTSDFSIPMNPEYNNDRIKFPGFEKKKPIRGFPSGDVYVETEETINGKNKDYDYLQSDDEEDDHQSTFLREKRSSTDAEQTPENFEKNFDDTQADSRIEKLNFPEGIVYEKKVGEQKLNETDGNLQSDIEKEKSNGIARSRRSLRDIDSILDAEMIFEDDNNMKDCQCRVNRGIKSVKRECKNCKKILDSSQFPDFKKFANSDTKLGDMRRIKRDVEGDEYKNDNDKSETTEASTVIVTSKNSPIFPESSQKVNLTKSIVDGISPGFNGSNETREIKETLGKSSQNFPEIQDEISATAPTIKQVRQAGNPKIELKTMEESSKTGQRKSKGSRSKKKLSHESRRTTTSTTTTTTTEAPTKPRKSKLRITTEEPKTTKAMNKPTVKITKEVHQKNIPRKSTGNKNPKRARKTHQESGNRSPTVPIKVNELKSTPVQKKIDEPKPFPVQRKENEAKKDVKVPVFRASTVSATDLRTDNNKLKGLIRKKLDSMKLKTEESADEKRKMIKREIHRYWDKEFQNSIDKKKTTSLTSEEKEFDAIDDIIKYIPEDYHTEEISESPENVKNEDTNFGQVEVTSLEKVSKALENHSGSLINRKIGRTNHPTFAEKRDIEITNKKGKYLCFKVDSSESSSEESNIPYKIIRRQNHSKGLPFREHELKLESHEKNYEDPKYSRWIFGKSSGDRSLKIHDRMKSDDISESLNSESFEDDWSISPVAQNKRQKRELQISSIDDSKNDIWGNTVEIKSIEKEKSKNDISNWNRYLKEVKSGVSLGKEDEGLSNFIQEAIPKIGNVLTNELGKVQNLTGSFEKLINNFDEAEKQIDTMDEKTQFEEAAMNNPDGLLTFDFFHDSIRYIKMFFDFLSSTAFKSFI